MKDNLGTFNKGSTASKTRSTPSRKGKKLNQPEQAIKNAILDFLKLKGFLAFPIWNSAVFHPSRGMFLRRHSKHYIPGTPDILVCGRWGRFIAIEVKANKNKTSDEQKACLEAITERGGFAMVAYSVEDVSNNLIRWGLL